MSNFSDIPSQFDDLVEEHTMFYNAAKERKDQWEPLKQGLFEGKYEVFERVYNEGEEYYKKYGRWE